MRKVLITILIQLISLSLIANDGIINSYGGNLFVAKETRIELKKERLSFKEIDGKMFVEVYFEFYNPDDQRIENVGFITPPSTTPDDIVSETIRHPNLSKFTVIVNGENLDYKVSKIMDTEFKSVFERPAHDAFVYYFKTIFRKGINIIKHSYYFEPSFTTGGVSGHYFYDYKLTTGKNWANSEIEDFELRIEKKGLFTVPLSFSEDLTNNWTLVGKGKIATEDYFFERVNNDLLFVNIESGYLVYKAKNLKPHYDLSIQSYNPIDYFEVLRTIYWSSMNRGHGLDKLDSRDYRIGRNALFAIHGYKFRDPELFDYFSKYFWYIPNETISGNVEILNHMQRNLFDRIVELEKEER